MVKPCDIVPNNTLKSYNAYDAARTPILRSGAATRPREYRNENDAEGFRRRPCEYDGAIHNHRQHEHTPYPVAPWPRRQQPRARKT